MDILPLKSWLHGFDNFPFIIAGPFSAESGDQLSEEN
jgi:hypothetical protein